MEGHKTVPTGQDNDHNKQNPLLHRDVWLVNDRLLLYFEVMVDYRGQSFRLKDRMKTDSNATGRLVFLYFLRQELNVPLNIAVGVQEVSVAIVANNGSDVEVGHDAVGLIAS